MRTLLLILFCATISYGQASPSTQSADTIGQILEKESVRSIIKNVVVTSIPQAKENFLITEQSLADLRSRGIPESFSSRLGSLKGQEIKGRENLERELEARVGEEQSSKYESQVAFYTQSFVIVTEDFYSRIEKLVLKTVSPKTGTETWLGRGFQQFMLDYIAYLRKHSEDKNTIIIGSRLDEFLSIQAEGCGKLPCDVPPCCSTDENLCASSCKTP